MIILRWTTVLGVKRRGVRMWGAEEFRGEDLVHLLSLELRQHVEIPNLLLDMRQY